SREHGPSAGVVVADAALRRGISGEQLQAVIAQQRSWPGAARARRVLALCDGRSESPLESLSRLRMIDSGLPAPTLQAEIGDLRGTFIARVDFYWDGYGIVGEADGAAKYTELRVLLAEQRRQNLLSEMGLVVVRWGWSDLAAFDVVADRFRRATARGLAPSSRARGWSVLSDLCPTRPWPNSSSRSQR
ncbi:MAG: hypothetical protein JO147_06205, partial [Actinobacteria bacterium]|nr:hypothetical protein [Actinomycetota bacterium]